MKNISLIIRNGVRHWVGDGFPVQTLFSYNTENMDISPFLLLDYAGPAKFAPSDRRRGVGEHPHRGFETVTLVYKGEVEHRDNAGNSGRIGPGDVQWMTAGKGVLHEEMHGKKFTEQGGELEMIQLWVNLPAKDKLTEPSYQDIRDDMIPAVRLDNDAGTIRIIAGKYSETTGPARTFSPVNLWDLRLKGSKQLQLHLPDGYTAAILGLAGDVLVNGEESVGSAELVQFTRDGDEISLETREDSTLLVMGGEPLDEPVVGYGPFVMNTEGEIKQAILDFRAGQF